VATAAKDLCKTNKRASGMQKPTKAEPERKSCTSSHQPACQMICNFVQIRLPVVRIFPRPLAIISWQPPSVWQPRTKLEPRRAEVLTRRRRP